MSQELNHYEGKVMNAYELCGWIGAILVLIAYYMVTTGKAHATSKPFQTMNIAGAVLLVLYTYNCQAYASMIVNVIWVAIGFSSFVKIINFNKVLKARTKSIKLAAVSLLAFVLMTQIAIPQEKRQEIEQNRQLKIVLVNASSH